MVYLVGAGPGDYQLLTLKAAECLEKADVVVYDHLADERILRGAPREAEFIYVGKMSARHTMKQEDISRLLVAKAQENKCVVRLKGGDPFVFGRGGEEALLLAENGLPFEIVPGVTSAIAVPAYAVAERNMADLRAKYAEEGKRVEDGYHLNRYFVEHPTDILGTLSARNRAFGVEPYVEGDDRGIKALADELSAVLSGIPANSYQPLPAALPVPQEIERPSNNQPFGFYEQNGSLVYYTPQGKIEAKGFDKKNEQKIRSAIRIRDVIREMFDAETHGCSDTELAQFQDKLNQLYEEHTKKYGRDGRDTDMLYQILMATEKVCAVAVFREERDKKCTVGLRSNGDIDVSAIASRFGGGGHKNASGLSTEGSLKTVMQKVIAELEETFNG